MKDMEKGQKFLQQSCVNNGKKMSKIPFDNPKKKVVETSTWSEEFGKFLLSIVCILEKTIARNPVIKQLHALPSSLYFPKHEMNYYHPIWNQHGCPHHLLSFNWEIFHLFYRRKMLLVILDSVFILKTRNPLSLFL